jgi:hypothetical protein
METGFDSRGRRRAGRDFKDYNDDGEICSGEIPR